MKITKNETGERPLYTGYHSKVNAYYYGTYVNGEEFDGCFDGYSATSIMRVWLLNPALSLIRVC